MELSPVANVVKGALLVLLSRRMAPGKRVNELALDEILRDVTRENWNPQMRRRVAYQVQTKFLPVLAMDENLSDVPGVLEGVQPNAAGPPVARDQDIEKMWAWLMSNLSPEVFHRMKADLGMQGPPARDYGANNNMVPAMGGNGGSYGNGYPAPLRNNNTGFGHNLEQGGRRPAQDSKIPSAEECFPDLKRIKDGGLCSRPRQPARGMALDQTSTISVEEAFPDILRLGRVP